MNIDYFVKKSEQMPDMIGINKNKIRAQYGNGEDDLEVKYKGRISDDCEMDVAVYKTADNEFHVVASIKYDDESFARSIYGEYHTGDELLDTLSDIMESIETEIKRPRVKKEEIEEEYVVPLHIVINPKNLNDFRDRLNELIDECTLEGEFDVYKQKKVRYNKN